MKGYVKEYVDDLLNPDVFFQEGRVLTKQAEDYVNHIRCIVENCESGMITSLEAVRLISQVEMEFHTTTDCQWYEK